MDRFMALKLSNEFKELQQRGLVVVGRKRLLTSVEWWTVLGNVWSSPEYGEWQQECRRLGDRFGLAPWTIEMACLLKDYAPDKQPNVTAVQRPQIGVVTDCTDQVFLDWLRYEAQSPDLDLHLDWLRYEAQRPDLHLHVYKREGSSDHRTGHFSGPPPLTPLTDSNRPPRHKAFMMRVDIPVDFPPEAAREIQKLASDRGRELLRRLGYSVTKRQRPSKLMSRADELRAGEAHLADWEIHQIIDNIYGEEDPEGGPILGHDWQRKRLIKAQRKALWNSLKDLYGFKE